MADVGFSIGRMAAAASALIESLEPERRQLLHAPFDSSDRREFTYLPGARPGLALVDMTAEQQALALELLATGLSDRGMSDARAVMYLEEILAGLERTVGRPGWRRRHSEYYWFRVLGEPGGGRPWAWKIGGHHLAVHLTIVGKRIAGAPMFFGANPARVPAGHPRAGLRTLADDEDLGRALVTGLPEHLRERAVTGPLAPSDIVTRHDPVADVRRIPPGLAYVDMDRRQRESLVRLMRNYLGRAIPEVAAATWAGIENAGLEQVSFRWAGSVEPGHGHYYAVLGPTFLLEYDNTQNNANHIHTVWRDLLGDWGEDLLAAHHAEHRH